MPLICGRLIRNILRINYIELQDRLQFQFRNELTLESVLV